MRRTLAIALMALAPAVALASPTDLEFRTISRFALADGNGARITGTVTGQAAPTTQRVQFRPGVQRRCRHLASVAMQQPKRYRFVVFASGASANAMCGLVRI